MKNLRKINQILFFLLIVFALLYIGSSFLIPFVFGIFFATLMTPFSNTIERVWQNRIFSSMLGTLVVLIVVGGILYIFIRQISLFVADLSAVRSNIQELIGAFQNWIMAKTKISVEDQRIIWQNRSESLLNTLELGLTNFLGNLANTAAGFFLVLVYVFLLLYYRDRFSGFILMYVKEDDKEEVNEVLYRISKVVYHYLWGRAKVMTLLGIMYYITFLIFDFPYALLLTIFGALVTIIPYLGPFISGLIPIVFSFIYLENIPTAVLFSSIIIVVQLIESYVLEPLIIGYEIRINPLIVIIAIVIGGAIWGLAGMVIFVPVFAMIKIISNHTAGLKPVGFLFGNAKKKKKKKQMPPHHT